MSDRLNATTHSAREAFVSRFGCDAEFIASAPGRVNLIGDHTDYNEGFAMPMPIDRHVVIAASEAEDGVSTVHSASLNESAELNIQDPLSHEQGWKRYVAGVFQLAQSRLGECAPMRVHIESRIPTGAGLSSSAAVAVGIVNLVEHHAGIELGLLDKAKLCQRAEHEFAGVRCGIMDQIAIASAKPGSAILLDCRSLEFEHIQLDPSRAEVVIIDTGVSRTLAGSVYGDRRLTCEQAAAALGVSSLREVTRASDLDSLNETHRKRASHVLAENERTRGFADAVRAGRYEAAGELMYRSHRSLRVDFEVSCGELDCLVESAERIGTDGGVLGCRMTGGGMGGCAVALVRAGQSDEVIGRLQADFSAKFGRSPRAFGA